VRVPRVYSLGRGVAAEVTAEQIAPLRAELRAGWIDLLGTQDRTPKIRPHVTVQNKVSGDQAKRALAEIGAHWDADLHGVAGGLGLWEYLGGPWRRHADFALGDAR
jgi:hypothetical protein